MAEMGAIVKRSSRNALDSMNLVSGTEERMDMEHLQSSFPHAGNMRYAYDNLTAQKNGDLTLGPAIADFTGFQRHGNDLADSPFSMSEGDFCSCFGELSAMR